MMKRLLINTVSIQAGAITAKLIGLTDIPWKASFRPIFLFAGVFAITTVSAAAVKAAGRR